MKAEIIDMLLEVGIGDATIDFYKEELERFFHMAQAAEREACAKVCETFYNHEAKDCAEAIRARGQA